MGLLDKIESGQTKNLSPSFSKTSETSLPRNSANDISFFDFITRYSLPHCAIFTKCDNNYIISKSAGFDGDSIISSLSTTDFWEGSINKNKWTFFSRSNNSIVTILQFFSKPLKDKIEFVGTYFENDRILFLAYDKAILPSAEMNAISANFKLIDFLKPSDFLKSKPIETPIDTIAFNYENALNNFVEQNRSIASSPSIATKIKRALQTELEYKLYLLSNTSINFIKTGEFKIVCNVYTKNNMSRTALKSFTNLNLKSILGSSVQLISYAD